MEYRKSEKDYKIATKNKSIKLEQYPFKKGEIIGNFIVNNDDYVYHHKRYQIELLCRCGNIKYRRLSHVLEGKNIWCAKCRGYNSYPENRKSNLFFINGIHVSWLSVVNVNLIRGSRILESTITNEDLINQYNKQNGCCIYTGIPLDIINVIRKNSNASIDRKDSNEGYVKNNIQWVYKPINIMKNNYSEEEFIFVCKKVSSFIR